MLTLTQIMYLKFILLTITAQLLNLINLIKDIFHFFQFFVFRFRFCFYFGKVNKPLIGWSCLRHEVFTKEVKCWERVRLALFLLVIQIDVDIVNIKIYWCQWSYFL